jgi:hypothetical protein
MQRSYHAALRSFGGGMKKEALSTAPCLALSPPQKKRSPSHGPLSPALSPAHPPPSCRPPPPLSLLNTVLFPEKRKKSRGSAETGIEYWCRLVLCLFVRKKKTGCLLLWGVEYWCGVVY